MVREWVIDSVLEGPNLWSILIYIINEINEISEINKETFHISKELELNIYCLSEVDNI